VVGGQSQSHLSTHFLSLSTTADFLGVFLLPAFGPLFRATGAPGAAAFGAAFGASSSSESRYAKMFLLRLA
jgi:hypothetical protein